MEMPIRQIIRRTITVSSSQTAPSSTWSGAARSTPARSRRHQVRDKTLVQAQAQVDQPRHRWPARCRQDPTPGRLRPAALAQRPASILTSRTCCPAIRSTSPIPKTTNTSIRYRSCGSTIPQRFRCERRELIGSDRCEASAFRTDPLPVQSIWQIFQRIPSVLDLAVVDDNGDRHGPAGNTAGSVTSALPAQRTSVAFDDGVPLPPGHHPRTMRWPDDHVIRAARRSSIRTAERCGIVDRTIEPDAGIGRRVGIGEVDLLPGSTFETSRSKPAFGPRAAGQPSRRCLVRSALASDAASWSTWACACTSSCPNLMSARSGRSDRGRSRPCR